MTLPIDLLQRLAAGERIPIVDGQGYALIRLIGVHVLAGEEIWTLTKEGREVVALAAERDELRLTLAAEQGRQEGAPSGWSYDGRRWFRSIGDIDLDVVHARAHPQDKPWEWTVWRPDDCSLSGFAATARTAMLAADAALSPPPAVTDDREETPRNETRVGGGA